MSPTPAATLVMPQSINVLSAWPHRAAHYLPYRGDESPVKPHPKPFREGSFSSAEAHDAKRRRVDEAAEQRDEAGAAWACIPSEALARVLHILGDTSSLRLVCKTWAKLSEARADEPLVCKATMRGWEDLYRLPSWTHGKEVKAVQLTLHSLRAPSANSGGSVQMPPARFGPGDARELAQTLARLQHSLARVRVPQEGVQLTSTASEHVPSDSDLNQAIDRVPGLRQLLGKVTIVTAK